MMKMEADDLVAELIGLSDEDGDVEVAFTVVVVEDGCVVGWDISVESVPGLFCSLGSSAQDNND